MEMNGNEWHEWTTDEVGGGGASDDECLLHFFRSLSQDHSITSLLHISSSEPLLFLSSVRTNERSEEETLMMNRLLSQRGLLLRTPSTSSGLAASSHASAVSSRLLPQQPQRQYHERVLDHCESFFPFFFFS